MSERSMPKLVLVSRHAHRIEQWKAHIEAHGNHHVAGCCRGFGDTDSLVSAVDPDAVGIDLERSASIHLVQGRTVPEIAQLERMPVTRIARCVRALYRRMEWDLRAGDLQLA